MKGDMPDLLTGIAVCVIIAIGCILALMSCTPAVIGISAALGGASVAVTYEVSGDKCDGGSD